MDIIEAIKSRRSIRRYKPDVPDREQINRILSSAIWAPSDGNKQPWSFIVAQGDKVKEIAAIFYGFAQGHIAKAPYIPAEKKTAMLEYSRNLGGAPIVVAVCYDLMGDAEATQDSLQGTSAAIENLLLAAHAEGLGTVWLSHILDYEETRTALGLGEGRRVAALIALGYPDEEPVVPPRIPVEEKTKWIR